MAGVDYRSDTKYLREQCVRNGIAYHERLVSFEADRNEKRTPCFLCSWNRRKVLFEVAQELGCNKIALGHHFSDVVETTLMGLLYGAQIQAMMPKLHSRNYPGVELIRPMYRVHEEDIIAWAKYHELRFLQCACRFTEAISESGNGVGASKRQEVKQLLKALRRDNPDVEKSVFNAIHAVSLDTFPGWKTRGEAHSFLEWYDERG
jgi:tRNA(Ile)-lysidine synthase TilS/MesJ